MNWIVFAIAAYLLYIAETGLRELLAVDLAWVGVGVAPSFLLVLLVFVAVSATPRALAWTALVLGALVDLSTVYGSGGAASDMVVLGPSALGFLVGGYVGIQLRGLVFRESVATHAVLTFVVGLFAHLVAVALLTARGLPMPLGQPVPGFSAADEMVRRFFSLLYTAILALPLSYVLLRTTPVWGFVAGHGPTTARYRRN